MNGAVQPQVPEEMGTIANLRIRRNHLSHRVLHKPLKETVKQELLRNYQRKEHFQKTSLKIR
ncbi:hypothetical protein U0070_009441 [Myodes glareolus]|uniref:Uncharacterized protein n=1 Tax=Myodes glareolus TaxID=447135 RepID=A0AAW0HY16_MYOGA